MSDIDVSIAILFDDVIITGIGEPAPIAIVAGSWTSQSLQSSSMQQERLRPAHMFANTLQSIEQMAAAGCIVWPPKAVC